MSLSDFSRRRFVATSLAASVALGVKGISAQDLHGSATPVSGDGTSVDVNAFDIGYEPSAISIAADTDATITLHNTGLLQHDLVIEGTDLETELLNGGDSGSITVNLPAGEYVFYCTVIGHREAGMQGTLTVG